MKRFYRLLTALTLIAAVMAPTAEAFAAPKDKGVNNIAETSRYRRSSLCSIMIKHTEDKYADEIEKEFLNIPIPDKYNNHDLSVKVVTVGKKGNKKKDIDQFISRNNIASRLVAKWFNRDIFTGECDVNMLHSRAFIDASVDDYRMAEASARGINSITDNAADELINSTYLLVNDITYVDKGKRSRNWGMALSMLGALAGAYTGQRAYSDLGNAVGSIVSTIKGFAVKINTHLYRLVWDDESAGTFYNEHFSDGSDPSKRLSFENNRNKYRLEYVGNVTSKGSRTSFLGINENEPEVMIRKATTRAIDDNVSDLMKKYKQFRVKTPITSVEPTITAEIGLKEGVTKDSKFEVLETVEKNGKIEYRRVGVVKPVPSRIWDNRFMADSENAYGADFGATTFVRVSGRGFYPGLLLREMD